MRIRTPENDAVSSESSVNFVCLTCSPTRRNQARVGSAELVFPLELFELEGGSAITGCFGLSW